MDLLSEEQISDRLGRLPTWSREGDAIVHVATLPTFSRGVLFVAAVAHLAEVANHHPDITIQWTKVTLTLSTHSAGGLTSRDFDLAEQIAGLGAGGADAGNTTG
jgi:4a-hydroxytetrahydrobiopterin dehydratase